MSPLGGRLRAIRIHETGGPEVLVLEEVDLPKPGPGQVRLRQHAVGVNYLDVRYRNGFYRPTELPFTPGNEGAGEVVEVGPSVKDFKPGDRVAYGGSIGSYAEERNIETRYLVKLPRGVSYETAAAIMLRGLTSQYLLRQTYRVKEGDTMLVHAAAGGVGLILCQWGRALGATVIGTVGSEDKAKLAKKAGAHHVIVYRDEDFVKRVDEITKGEKCHVVYDGVGQRTFFGSLECLKPFGTFASFGSASGVIAPFDIGLLRNGSPYVTRATLSTFLADRERADKMARDLFRAVGAGEVTIKIDKRFPLGEAAEAHRDFEARDSVVSFVLLP
jgi:NADPH:quinone reductase